MTAKKKNSSMNFKSFENVFRAEVSGSNVSEDLIESVVDQFRLARLGLLGSRPIGVFLIGGPTGSGKTHLVYSVAQALHYSNLVLRVDCAEFQQGHETSKLTGAPPGFLGHRETAAILSQENLTKNASAASPYSVLLFDEIEKAHEDLFKMLLSIYDYGTLQLGDGNKTDFTKTIIFMTSNIKEGISFNPGFLNSVKEDKQKKLVDGVKKNFKSEFVNRLDYIYHFPQVTKDGAREIIKKFHSKAQADCLKVNLFLPDMTKKVLENVLSSGYSEEYGARELRRAYQRLVLIPFVRQQD